MAKSCVMRAESLSPTYVRGCPSLLRFQEFGEPALMYAARYGHYDAAKALLRGGADPNAINPKARQFLWTAMQLCLGSLLIPAISAVNHS